MTCLYLPTSTFRGAFLLGTWYGVRLLVGFTTSVLCTEVLFA